MPPTFALRHQAFATRASMKMQQLFPRRYRLKICSRDRQHARAYFAMFNVARRHG